MSLNLDMISLVTFERLRLVILATILTGVTACGSAPADGAVPDEPVVVVATTTMLGDVASNVVGDQATLEVLMPVGADPHDFQASSQQVSSMSSADLIVANGLGLEEGLVDVLAEVESDGSHVMEVAAFVDPLPFGGEPACDPSEMDDEDHEDNHEDGDHDDSHDHEDGDHDHAHDHDHDHGSCDPHIWMDPLRMAEAALLIADELEAIAPGGGWTERAEAYATELAETHEEIVEMLAGVPQESREMVTNHDAFGYFASLYGFEIVGLVIPSGSTLAEPSSGDMAELVEQIEREWIEVIFSDSTAPSNLAQAVADDAGDIRVVELYTGSIGEPGSGADSLIGMLTSNARAIADALS